MSNDKKADKKATAPINPTTKTETVPNVKGPAVPVVIVEGQEKPKKERKAAAPKGNFLYKKVGDIADGGKKLPLQAQQTFDIIKEAGNAGIARETLLEKMKIVVVTRQPMERILGYYQPRLVSGNLIVVTAPAAPAVAPTATK